LAGLHRWADALSLYEALTTDRGSPFHAAAVFGTAEMLRALGKPKDALRKLNLLLHDQQWASRAQLRAAELYIDLGDAPNAPRLLAEMKPTTIASEGTARVAWTPGADFAATGESIRHVPTLLKRPDGTSHATLIAALFGIAEAHLQLKTPESGDDFIETIYRSPSGRPGSPYSFRKIG